jgi:hypothetical protein
MNTPNFESIKTLEALIKRYVNKYAVDQALDDYNKWASNLKEDKKEIVHLLYLLKSAEERSGNTNLKHEKQISELVLSKAEIPNPDRRTSNDTQYFTLLQKEIGPKYQIDVEFQDKKGSRVRKNIFNHVEIN